MGAPVVVEGALPLTLLAQQVEVDVGDRPARPLGEAVGLDEQLAVLVDERLAVPRQVGGRLPLARRGVEVRGEAAEGGAAAQLLAVVGTIGPYVFFTPWFAEMGLSPAAFVMGGFANGVAGGFTVDVIVSSIAFWVWLGAERAPRAWLYMLLNLTIGLSCALPLYLYFREARAAQPSAAYSG